MKKVQIIAEIGNSHEGSVGLAKCFIKSAAECGVDAVKFQTHIFDAESLPDAPNPPYFTDETRKEYFERTGFSLDEWITLKKYAENELRLEFISSPFSLEAIELLEEVGLNTYKIPSGEVTNLPLLIRIAKTNKRVILSSGMSSIAELDCAINVLQENGCNNLIVLQCTSEYPCPADQTGINLLSEFGIRYGLPVGFSDHTIGTAVSVAAVALGATVIEKHFTLSKKMYGSDAKNSTEPDEFRKLVQGIRDVEMALNNTVDKNQKVESLRDMKVTFEKSIVASRDLSKGAILTETDLAYKKPGDGISAAYFKNIIGRKVIRPIKRNTKISYDDLH